MKDYTVFAIIKVDGYDEMNLSKIIKAPCPMKARKMMVDKIKSMGYKESKKVKIDINVYNTFE